MCRSMRPICRRYPVFVGMQCVRGLTKWPQEFVCVWVVHLNAILTRAAKNIEDVVDLAHARTPAGDQSRLRDESPSLIHSVKIFWIVVIIIIDPFVNAGVRVKLPMQGLTARPQVPCFGSKIVAYQLHATARSVAGVESSVDKTRHALWDSRQLR